MTIAFQKIVGRWDPDLQNHRAAEEGNISLKPASHAADTSSIYTRYPLSHLSVSLNTRDDLLAAVLKNCEPHNVAKVASAFPSPQMIEHLLLRFLDSHSLLEDTWIHIPTFQVDDAPPELLLSCIASYAMDSSNNNFRRFGKALHSVLHPYLFQVVSVTLLCLPTALCVANKALPTISLRNISSGLANCNISRLLRSLSKWASGVETGELWKYQKVLLGLYFR